jgi:hypothetical protein
MAGTIFGLPLSQQFDANGRPLSGAKLYLYSAGTSTPVDAFEDFGLTAGLELTHPIVADSAGRIPEFWLNDGSYRVRLTDADGNEIFDISSTTALGASSGSGGASSGVSESAIFQTGDFLWNAFSGTRSGWVRANARTIGSSSSGGTERASSDCEDLFLYLWNNFSNTACPVSTGRGASAAADWSANKTITLLDMRGRTCYGLDTMANSAAAVIDTATSVETAVGAEDVTVLQANFPSLNFTHSLTAATHTHDSGTLTVASHTHGAGSYAVGTAIDNGSAVATSVDGVYQGTDGGSESGTPKGVASATISLDSGDVSGSSSSSSPAVSSGATAASGALTVSGTVASGGSGTALATLAPGRPGTWYIKL